MANKNDKTLYGDKTTTNDFGGELSKSLKDVKKQVSAVTDTAKCGLGQVYGKLGEIEKRLDSIVAKSGKVNKNLNGISGGGSNNSKTNERDIAINKIRNDASKIINDRKSLAELNDKYGKSYFTKAERALQDSKRLELQKIQEGQKYLESLYSDSSKSIEEIFNEAMKTAREIADSQDKLNELEKKGLTFRQQVVKTGVDTVIDIVKSCVNQFLNTVEQGFAGYLSGYENTFNAIASGTGEGATGSRKGTRAYYSDAGKLLDATGNANNAVNFNTEVMPALAKVAGQGLQGNRLTAKAVNDAIDNKIIPKLNTDSEGWVNMSAVLEQNQLKMIKGQMLVLQETQGGNRLLQSGIISQLTDQISPLLTNIDYNTGGEQNLSAEYQSIMQGLIENSNYTPQEAYVVIQKMMSADKNLGNAITNGDTMTQLYAMGKASGKNSIDAYAYANNTTTGIASNTSNDLYASLVMGTLGYWGSDWLTLSKAKQSTSGTSATNVGKMKSIFSKLSNGKTTTDAYDTAVGNAQSYVTVQQSFDNAVQNFGKAVKLFLTGIVGSSVITSGLFKGIRTLLNSSLDTVCQKILGKFLGGSGSGGGSTLSSTLSSVLKNTSSKVSLESIGSASKVGSVLSKALPVAGIVAGVTMGVVDGVKSVQKSSEWGTSKSSAFIGGFLSGSGEKGLINYKSANADEKKDIRNKTLWNMGKYGLVGAGIGGLVGGPLGAIAGGLIGASVGLVASILSGKQVAQALDKGKASLVKSIGLMFGKTSDAVSSTTRNGVSATAYSDYHGSHAIGLPYVPYDGYLASLHQSEAILTKTDADNYRKYGIANSDSTLEAYAMVQKMTNADKNLTYSITSGDAVKSVELLNKINSASTQSRGNTTDNEVKTTDTTDKIINAIAGASASIVDAIANMYKGNTNINNKSNLLPNITNSRTDSNMVNLSPVTVSMSTII